MLTQQQEAEPSERRRPASGSKYQRSARPLRRCWYGWGSPRYQRCRLQSARSPPQGRRFSLSRQTEASGSRMRHCSGQTQLRTHRAGPPGAALVSAPFSPRPRLARVQGRPGACAGRPDPVESTEGGAGRKPPRPHRGPVSSERAWTGSVRLALRLLHACFCPTASYLPPPPPSGALKADSCLITRGSSLCRDVSGVPGPICLACLLGTLL